MALVVLKWLVGSDKWIQGFKISDVLELYFCLSTVAPPKSSTAKKRLFNPLGNRTQADQVFLEKSREEVYYQLSHLIPDGCFTSFFPNNEPASSSQAVSEPATDCAVPLQNLIVKLSSSRQQLRHSS